MNSTEGCLVACINNYVWVDVSTGLFPKTRVLSDSYACIPCKSDYIRSGLVDKSVLLYSVWNFTGAVVPQKGSVLAQVCSDFSVRDWCVLIVPASRCRYVRLPGVLPGGALVLPGQGWGLALVGPGRGCIGPYFGGARVGLGPCLGGAWARLHRT